MDGFSQWLGSDPISPTDLIGLVTIIVAAVSAGLSARAADMARKQAVAAEEQAVIMRRSHELSVSAARADSLFEIANRWSAIYLARNAVLAAEPIWEGRLAKEYGTDFNRFLNSPDWLEVRDVCNFFELLGMMLRENMVTREALFVLVTVDRFSDPDFPEGVMFERLRGRIEYLRKHYRPDIYTYYDQYLLPEYRKYLNLLGDKAFLDRIEESGGEESS